MKTAYYILENNTLRRVGSVIKTSRGWVSNPTAEDYAAMVDANGKPNPAYPRSEESFAPPKCDEGYHAVFDKYDLQDGKWVKLWKVEPIQYTYDDYNRALEDYIREVRFERGYTDREPTEYIGSKVPRWDSDGRDYQSFRDDVMLYALPILNKYKNNEEVPSLAEFKAGFPKMVWSYTE